LAAVIKEIGYESLYMPVDPEKVLISPSDLSRPGLELAGFFDYYDSTRIVVLGRSELAFLMEMEMRRRSEILDALFSRKAPAVLITRGMEPLPELVSAAERYQVPLLRTNGVTSNAVARLVSFLNIELAPRVTRHGVLVEVYGEGILITGDSGVGKSETAIELVKRGHRLIADDAVELKRASDKTLVGSAPQNIRHFIELRGVGIINARRIFGMGAVKQTEKVDMIIQLENWDSTKVYDRMGMANEYGDILGVEIPLITIPVKPGRNLAVIIEVAAMNNRQKKLGYNATQELLVNLGMDADSLPQEPKVVYKDWVTHKS
jgi:HPr kinase/phosphorylase